MKLGIRYLLFFKILLFKSSFLFSQSNGIQTAGDVALFALPVSALTTTLLKKDTKGTWQFLKGAAFNQVVVNSLKLIIDKPRPDLSNNNSFPSGHTATTFHSASFIHRRYGFKYSIPGYLIAGFTGYSRLRADKHDGYDVLVGAIVGIGSTYLFTSPYQKEHLKLSYTSFNGNHLLGMVYNF